MAIDFPNSPAENEQYTVGDRTWTWNGTYWEMSTSTSTFTAGDSEPVDADPGDIWFDSTIGKTFVNYSGTWVEIGNAATVVDVIADADADTKVQVEVTADSDKIEFTTAGTKRLEIDASGHVIPAANETYDLGSASNRFRDLYLSGTSINLGGAEISSDGTNLTMPPVSNISGDFTVGTDVLHVDHANSRVGIGTTTPAHPLHVDGDAGNQTIAKLQSSQTAATYSLVEITDATDNGGAYIGYNPGASLNNTDSYLMLGMGGDDVNGGNGIIVGKGGNVGIGTNSPTARLDIEGETQAAHITLDRGGISDSQPAIDIQYPGGSNTYNYFMRVYNDASSTATMFVNGTARTADGGTSTMTIRNDNGASRFGRNTYATTIEGVAVHMPDQPRVSGYMNGYGSSVANANYVMNSLIVNNGGGYNAGTGVYTVPASGTYLMNVTAIAWPNPGYGYFDFKKNGAMFTYTHWNVDNASGWETASGSTLINCVAGDTLEIYVRVIGGNQGIYGNQHNNGLIMKVA